MPRFRLMEENVTRSIVFERSELLQMEEYAASLRRSLSSVIRDAVALYLTEVVGSGAAVTPGHEKAHDSPASQL